PRLQRIHHARLHDDFSRHFGRRTCRHQRSAPTSCRTTNDLTDLDVTLLFKCGQKRQFLEHPVQGQFRRVRDLLTGHHHQLLPHLIHALEQLAGDDQILRQLVQPRLL
ncbi:MAG: hypothetical protein ACK559_26080, partial [bacterium]